MLAKYIAALFLITAPAFAAPKIGESAPAFTTTDINGKVQSLDQYRGKIVVLEWTNPGCPFVRKHYDSGNMQHLQDYAKNKGVIWLNINSGAEGKQGHLTSAEAKESLEKDKALPTAYILDGKGELGRLYGATATPHMFVVDAQGKLSYAGAIDDKPTADKADIASARNYVKETIDALLAGKPVVTAETKPYGCSVKY